MGTNKSVENQQETSVTEFCYKIENLSLEELKNIKIILFLQCVNYSDSTRQVTFFNQQDSSLGLHVNAPSPKSLQIQA